jgi:hypothetical protein
MAFQLNALAAQLSCDSTYAICDSITIDTIFFTHNDFGDRIHIRIRTEHESIYAPIFTICPEDGSTQFEDPDFDFFGIGGPATIYLYYQFEVFDFTAEEFYGEIIIGNSNYIFSDCMISFSALTGNTPNALNENSLQDALSVSPNPVSGFLNISLRNPNLSVKDIHLLDASGRKHPIFFSGNQLNLSAVPAGLFFLQVTLNDGQLITKKIVKQ